MLNMETEHGFFQDKFHHFKVLERDMIHKKNNCEAGAREKAFDLKGGISNNTKINKY